MSDARRALVFGGSGAIGAALLPRLRAAGWQVDALSRDTRPAQPGLRWLRGEFATLPDLPARADAIFSCGPLDLFSHWYADATIDCPRVVAFGSTSDATKRAADDPGERELAARLAASSARVLQAAAARGTRATLLRPTLVYGSGRDRNLSRIAALARGSGWFVLPSDARGLRQPVHVDDLADAALAVVDVEAAAGRDFALPGGETLPYRDMVARTLATLEPAPRLLLLPSPLFAAALFAARLAGRLQGLPPGAVARMRADLVFDATPARVAFGYAPRAFAPDASMFRQD
ncbi:NAD-dependent epimerase/dehydratase family protein [Luteimonas sp. BDR2-5]|uniref:NAD-dependent epimerase/dehydratase family protein n=1 Tax=Proluteimonas luteida TaxID=2878685 RepID=UPI001E48BEFB|nr:NAD-dependent epimerase/dehydratase family protein [Luteimonas sp. BDR2-5]MCD9029286.1 NAD-dependent epimerase/dehydratase family protein [Luteimonas sp. BDR2-5]